MTLTERVARAISGTGLIRDRDTEEVIALVFEAIEASGTHVVAPVVPTMEMIVDATEQWLCIAAMEDRAEVIWDAMIQARPKVTP